MNIYGISVTLFFDAQEKCLISCQHAPLAPSVSCECYNVSNIFATLPSQVHSILTPIHGEPLSFSLPVSL